MNGVMDFPLEISYKVLDIRNPEYVATVISLTEIDTVSISKDESLCQDYSDEYPESEMTKFTECCRKGMSEHFPEGASCQLAGFDFFLPENGSLSGCKNKTEAKMVLETLIGGVIFCLYY